MKGIQLSFLSLWSEIMNHSGPHIVLKEEEEHFNSSCKKIMYNNKAVLPFDYKKVNIPSVTPGQECNKNEKNRERMRTAVLHTCSHLFWPLMSVCIYTSSCTFLSFFFFFFLARYLRRAYRSKGGPPLGILCGAFSTPTQRAGITPSNTHLHGYKYISLEKTTREGAERPINREER